MSIADSSFGAALTTLADSALSPSSFHHSGVATSATDFSRSRSKAFTVAPAQPSESTGRRSMASRYRDAASTWSEIESAALRLKSSGLSDFKAVASLRDMAALCQSSLEAYREPSASRSIAASPAL
eukprot:scaffold11175_cov63-Phaeocystis_antarctica.AAC.5